MTQKTFVLTWIYGTKATEVFRSPQVRLVQQMKAKLKKEPAYFKGRFEVRTLDGFAHKPILKSRNEPIKKSTPKKS